MTPDNDQNGAFARLSPNARRMMALREDVLHAWKTRLCERGHQGRALPHPILIDTLPVFYAAIAESISPGCLRLDAGDGNTLASEHGGERARMTAYDHGALIEEYQVFRWAIFEVLHRHDVVLDLPETHAVNASIDAGIQEAVEAFSLVHNGFRERFAAALTHDLRGPLGTSVMALELILMANDPEKMKLLAARALQSTRRMGGMIDELLDTMAFHDGQQLRLAMAPVDLDEVIAEVRGDAAQGERIGKTGPSVHGWWDRGAIKRTLENLLTNALKYGSPGTPITIAIACEHDRMRLSVHNEGNPIPPQEQETIFQMYRRSESALRGPRQGWGIGLPYVRAVAESHGGSVILDSGAGRGTTFTIDVPLDARPWQDAPSLARAPS